MAILGDNQVPATGSWFDVTGNKQYWTTQQFTMPAGGGIANTLNVYCGGDGGAVTGQLLIWDNTGAIFYQSGNITIPSRARGIGNQAWVIVSAIAGTYIPAAPYEIGFWSSGSVNWTSEGTGGVTGRSGLSSPGTATGGTEEYQGLNSGRLGAFVDYNPGGVLRVNTGTSGSPVWTVNAVRINTGTAGAPVWTNARWRVNTGTSGAPVWTDAT